MSEGVRLEKHYKNLNLWGKSTRQIWICVAKALDKSEFVRQKHYTNLNLWDKSTHLNGNLLALKAQNYSIQWVRAYGWEKHYTALNVWGKSTTQIWICEAKHASKRQLTGVESPKLFNTMGEGVWVGKALHSTECVRQKHYTNLNLWGKAHYKCEYCASGHGEANSLK